MERKLICETKGKPKTNLSQGREDMNLLTTCRVTYKILQLLIISYITDINLNNF